MRTKQTPKTIAAISIGLSLLVSTAYAGSKERKMKADTDGSGTVSYEEFLAQAKERFMKMDSDNDGQITSAEFKALRAGDSGDHQRAQKKGKAGKKPKGARKGGKGKKGKDGPKGERLLQDRNGDGAITEDDMPERAKKMFKRIDKDGNGEISTSEKEAFRDRMKKRGGKKGKRGGKREQRD